MIGAAASDLHLGYRAFAAREGGRNAREVDVERAWAQVVEGMIAADPALITIAGDIFHNPRPSVHALIAWRDGIARLLEETDAHIIAIPGNHDAPRTAESVTPVVIPDDLGGERFRVVQAPERVHFDAPGLLGPGDGARVAVACFPFVPLSDGKVYRLAPDAAADLNVLLVHAAVAGDPAGDALPHFYGASGALDIAQEVGPGVAEVDRWDVVACGDFHDFRRLHPTALAFYSGAIEYTTSNIWAEEAAKGFVLYDTETGTLLHVAHETRPVYGYRLEAVSGEMCAAIVNDHLEEKLGLAPHADVVRWRVDDFPRHERELIDWAAVRELKARCLHFELDLRWAAGGEDGEPQHRASGAQSLPARAYAFLRDDPPQVRRCACNYLGIVDPESVVAKPAITGAGEK